MSHEGRLCSQTRPCSVICVAAASGSIPVSAAPKVSTKTPDETSSNQNHVGCFIQNLSVNTARNISKPAASPRGREEAQQHPLPREQGWAALPAQPGSQTGGSSRRANSCWAVPGAAEGQLGSAAAMRNGEVWLFFWVPGGIYPDQRALISFS